MNGFSYFYKSMGERTGQSTTFTVAGESSARKLSKQVVK